MRQQITNGQRILTKSKLALLKNSIPVANRIAVRFSCKKKLGCLHRWLHESKLDTVETGPIIGVHSSSAQSIVESMFLE
jgi:hypothetical protein